MDRGYIRLWRKITETAFYKNPLTCHLAIHLLLQANHKDRELLINGQIIKIKRGQVLTGRKKLSLETGLSQQNIRTALKHLQISNFLTIKSTKRFTLITILNYDRYQGGNKPIKPPKTTQPNQQSNQPPTNHQPTTNQPLTTNNNVKNDKNVKNNIYSPASKKAGGLSLENLEKQVMASPYFTDEYNYFFSERKIQYFMDMLNRLGKKKSNSFTPTQIIVEFYKQLKRFVDDYGVNEKAWDRINFKRFSKSASQMYSIGNEDIVFTLSLLYRTAARLKTKNLDWTLETCVKYSPEILVEFKREEE